MKKNKRLWLIIILFLIILVSIEYYRSNRFIQVSGYTIRSEKISAPIRLVFLSDLHGKEFGDGNRRLLDKISAQAPDLIALGGDIFSNDADEVEIEQMCGFIRDAKEIAPVYFGIGNHEHAHKGFWVDGAFDAHQSPLARIIKDSGAIIIESEYLDIEVNGNPIRLGGYMGYYHQPGMFSLTQEQRRAELVFAADFENTDRFKLLLNHIPTSWLDWDYRDKYPVDLVLSGHYHGGVIRIPFIEKGLYAPYIGWLPPYTRGMYVGKAATCILTTGLAGYDWVPRFFNPPEICVVDILPSDS